MTTDGKREFQTKHTSREDWETLANELRKPQDLKRTKELVMLLEQAIFDRQQELALNADKADKREVNPEEQALKEVLDLMLEVKVKKLGFPAVKYRNPVLCVERINK